MTDNLFTKIKYPIELKLSMETINIDVSIAWQITVFSWYQYIASGQTGHSEGTVKIKAHKKNVDRNKRKSGPETGWKMC